MTHKSIDYRDLQIPFGSYVQANEETVPRNSNKARTLDCIYLQPSDNRQAGHEVMHVQTGQLLTRTKVTRVPMTKAIIDDVERLAKRQGMRKSFKIQTREESQLVPADWIAGVDHDLYAPEAEDDDDDPDYEEMPGLMERDNNYDSSDDEDSDDEDDYYDDEIDESEIDDLIDDPAPRRANNANPQQEPDPEDTETVEQEEQATDESGAELNPNEDDDGEEEIDF